MARSRAMVTLYSKLSGSLFISTNVIRHVRWPEAIRLRDEKQIRLLCRHCGKESQSVTCTNRGGHRIIGQFREELREQVGRPGTITLAEIYANAGLFGGSRTARLNDEQRSKRERAGHEPEDFIERAASKISQYRTIGDDRAVRA